MGILGNHVPRGAADLPRPVVCDCGLPGFRHYIKAVAVTIVTMLVVACVMILSGLSRLRPGWEVGSGRQGESDEGTGRYYLHLGSGGGAPTAGGDAALVALPSCSRRRDRRGDRRVRQCNARSWALPLELPSL